MGNHDIMNLTLDLIEDHIPFYQKLLFLSFFLILTFLSIQALFEYMFYQKKLRIVRKLDTSFLDHNSFNTESFLYMKKVCLNKKTGKKKNKVQNNDSKNKSFYFECEICTERQDLLI